MINFAINETLPTLNVLLRLHWSKRGAIAKRVQRQVWLALREQDIRPAEPLPRVRIRIRRFCRREPDPDGMPSTAKLLLDVLQPMSKRHPLGLGLIADDSSACVESLIVEHVPRAIARTEVEIEPV